MKQAQMAMMVLMVFICLVFAGCAAIQALAPSAVDEAGNVIPGTHELTDTAKSVTANLGVYGQAAAAIPLLIWNFVELAKGRKSKKGLVATVMALKQAADDPSTKKQFEDIKGYLKSAHKVAGVDLSIKNLLAKL